MNNQPRVLNFDDVIELCGSVATSRGQVYKASGAVQELEWLAEGSVLAGTVQGSQSEPYHARITIAPHRFDGECSCPARYNCKHVAATLLSWIEKQTATPTPDDQALRAVNRWLQKLVDQGRKTAPLHEHHEPGEPLLFYQLDNTALTQNQNGITLQILQSRLLKRGGYGKESPYRYNGHYYHPDWVLHSDRAILELAIGRQSDFSYRELTVEGDIGHLLMNKLIDCGRCFWGEDREHPLTRSSTRVLSFDWKLDDKECFSLTTRIDGVEQWTLVPTDPPWYLDIGQSTAGLLENAPPVSLLTQFVEAPPLPEAHAQAVSNYLASRLPDSSLPLPKPPNFVRISEAPLPVLVLQSRDDSPDIRDFYASIKFRYADYLLPFDGMEADATLEGKTPDGKPLVLKRDLPAEVRFSVDFGKQFPEFESAQNSDAEFFSRADRKPRALEVQRIARSWRELLDERSELSNRGWTVQIREPFDLSFQAVTQIEATVSETTSNWFDMALKLRHGEQQFDLLPLVIDWLQGDSRDSSILLQAEDGQWLEVSPDLFAPVAETLMELYDDPTGKEYLRMPRQRAATLDTLESHWKQQGVSVAWDKAEHIFDLAERLRNFQGIQSTGTPKNVHATLRPYQLDGMAWLGFLAEYGFNGILADDMGLGKTLQTLGHLQQERDMGRLTQPTLIVAPTSLLGNWQREAAKFTPRLRTLIWHGTGRKLDDLVANPVEIVITSYALVTRDIDLLSAQNFGCVVLDEAQAIKNPTAKVTQALKTLTIERRICLTGTPLENHLGELWSQFDFLMPGFLGTRKHFNRYFRTPIENHGSTERQQRLSALIRPFLLRRRKEQVATELPPKTEIIREVTLEPRQARLYESIRVSMEQRVRALLAERGLARSHIEMLDALLKLRQTCCHPALVKLDSARGIQESAKTELLMSMLEELIDEGKKILLFSQFTEMLGLIEAELSKRNIRYTKLTGRTRKRDEVIDSFQHGDVPLFLISLKAGGTGLNLTAADTVIHYDPWWNPAVENQASDRAHRIGQTKPVFIYKLVASNTVEEKIMAMQQHKKLLADQTINDSEGGALQNLTAEDIMDLFAASEDSEQSLQ
ncbi:DEAD/DEAH box helicase [Granulosicoccus sp. 3-233]|uniref:DEAD/DEAH box helicase n=1 Tax=Granulosicoccus sp. 3-233 TaxID=3417969 RepID=UPI003D348C83